VSDRPLYRLIFRPEPGERIPDPIRLRKLLKILLRGYGFRCLAVEELPPVAQAVTEGTQTANRPSGELDAPASL
jgi:hypothetical protein